MTRTMTVLGRLTAAEDRTLKGTLLPFGTPGHTSAGRVVANASSVVVPNDVAGLHCTLDHLDERDNVATFEKVEATEGGLVASWTVPKTHGGDKLLAEFRSGKRTGISVELEPYAVKDGVLVDSVLVGCAFPEKPAFDTARLVASLAEDTDEEDEDDEEDVEDEDLDDEEDDDTDEPDEGHDNPESKMPKTATAARAPRDLKSARGRRTSGRLTAENATPQDAYKLFAAYAQTRDRRLLAALNDITGSSMSNRDVPQWLGELWNGNTYERQIVPLLAHADLTSFTIKGWRWTTKPQMDTYSGDKAAIPSNTPTIEPDSINAIRLAGGHDIDRKFRDFGDQEFFASYFAAMTESYARLTDAKALRDVKLDAQAVTPGTVPTGFSKEWAALLDAALSLIDLGTPTFAVVEKSVYRQMFFENASNAMVMIEKSLGLKEGSMSGFRILPWAASPSQTAGAGNRFPGLDSGEILVGIGGAATFHELGGGSPIRVEAEHIANGGIDEACFGYCGTFVQQPKAFALVDLTADV